MVIEVQTVLVTIIAVMALFSGLGLLFNILLNPLKESHSKLEKRLDKLEKNQDKLEKKLDQVLLKLKV